MSYKKAEHERAFLRLEKQHTTKWARIFKSYQREALVIKNDFSGRGIAVSGTEVFYRMAVLEKPGMQLAIMGLKMEQTAEELKAINSEAKESVQLLKETYNEVKTARSALDPEMLSMIKSIRSMRQTVTMELQQSLSIMRDVRKFFLESEYKQEIERLTQFVTLAERMKSLIKDGTMDAISDIVLKLAVGREEKSDKD